MITNNLKSILHIALLMALLLAAGCDKVPAPAGYGGGFRLKLQSDKTIKNAQLFIENHRTKPINSDDQFRMTMVYVYLFDHIPQEARIEWAYEDGQKRRAVVQIKDFLAKDNPDKDLVTLIICSDESIKAEIGYKPTAPPTTLPSSRQDF